MVEYGILIDTHWCTGCHTCETACQMENQLPVGQYGIKISEIGPWEYAPEKWQLSYDVSFTDQCVMCLRRRKKGKIPTCVHHCQAKCMEFGKIDDLVEKLKDHPKQTIVSFA